MKKEHSEPRILKKTNLIGQILIEKGLISSEQLEEALRLQKKGGQLLGSVLVSLGLIPEETLGIVLANQCGLTFIPIERYNISKGMLKMIPQETLLKYSFVPLEMIGGVVTVAMANPFDEEAKDAMRRNLPYKVVLAIAGKTQIEKIINTHYKD